MSRKRHGYTISVVADMYEVHPQTLRAYERHGLLEPSRTEGNTRLYTQNDLKQLEVILTLTRELGVNLAGVEVILNMRRKMERMQQEMERWIEYLCTQFREDPEFSEERFKEALVRVPQSPLVRIFQEERPRSR